MKKLIFKGAATALITPMNNDGTVNYVKIKELTENQILNGINALVVNGTTGESATLTDIEMQTNVRSVVAQSKGRVPVIAGAGSNSTEHALLLATQAKEAGADCLLLVTPYYNKTSQSGLIKHYLYIADRVELPIIVYNVPSRTGLNIKPETYKALAEHPNIVAAKEANGDLSALAKSLYLCGDSLTFYSGNDDQTIPFLSMGAMGVISVSSNLLPSVMSKICHYYFAGEVIAARKLMLEHIGLINSLFCDVNPIPIKTAMNMCGFAAGPVRPPLYGLKDSDISLLESEIKRIL